MTEGSAAIIAGLLAGALFGMIFIAHASLVLAFRPPAILTNRVQTNDITGTVMIGTVGS